VPRAWVRARRTILSADAVSFLAAVILYYFAAGDVKGFAFTLGLSTILDLVVVFMFHPPADRGALAQRDLHLTAVLGTRCAPAEAPHPRGCGVPVRSSRSMSLFGRMYRGEVNIDFVGKRRRWYAISGALLLICVLSFVLRGFNWGVEFRGGSTFTFRRATSSWPTPRPRCARPARASRCGSTSAPARSARCWSPPSRRPPPRRPRWQNAVAKRFGLSATQVNVTSVSSSWGSEITRKALVGLAVFLVAVCAFIAVRFEPKMAIGRSSRSPTTCCSRPASTRWSVSR